MSRARKDTDSPHTTCKSCGWHLSNLWNVEKTRTTVIKVYICSSCGAMTQLVEDKV